MTVYYVSIADGLGCAEIAHEEFGTERISARLYLAKRAEEYRQVGYRLHSRDAGLTCAEKDGRFLWLTVYEREQTADEIVQASVHGGFLRRAGIGGCGRADTGRREGDTMKPMIRNTVETMRPAVGAQVLVRCEDMYIPCVVRDAKNVYGEVRLLVAPIGGLGEQWVTLGRIRQTNAVVTADVRIR